MSDWRAWLDLHKYPHYHRGKFCQITYFELDGVVLWDWEAPNLAVFT